MPNNNPYLPNLNEPAATRKARKWPWILLACVAALAVLCGGSAIISTLAGSKASTYGRSLVPSSGAPVDSPKAIKKTPGVGQPVRDGKFEFVINKVDCQSKHLGDTILGVDAQGKFCLINITVKNIGNEAQIITGGWQEAYSADGKKYSDDAAAELYANNNDDPLLGQINPGNGVTGNLVYDIPPDSAIVKMKLHDSPFSGGVWVAILG